MSESNGTHYFVKELLSNKVRLPSGRPIPWESAGDDMGVLSTNDPGLIEQLKAAVRRGVGGIREVDEDGFNSTKKNSTAEQLHKLSLFRANNILNRPRISDAGVVAAGKPAPRPNVSPAGEPIKTPQTIPLPKPPSRRRSVLAEAAKVAEPSGAPELPITT